jgi:hypothetical protein
VPIPQSLERLHSIRAAEEQQQRTQMNAALAELHRLQSALGKTRERLRQARSLVATSVCSGKHEDRIAGIEEAAIADRLAKLLAGKIKTAEQHFIQVRAQFLAKRVERRQVETLLDAAREQSAIEGNRKAQSALDEWFRSRPTPKGDKGRRG